MQKKALKILSTLWIHLLGIALMTVLIPAALVDVSVFSSLADSFAYSEFREFTALDLAIQIGLSACSWALLYIMYRLVVEGIRKRKTDRAYKLSRGTVMTETLIVLPAFLIISLGTMQLAINNIAAVLTNLATFQAARAVFVWSGEMHGSRGGGYMTMMNKARLQAAQSLAPVAPGDYRRNLFITNGDFYRARAGMLGQQLPALFSDQGAIAMPLTFAVELEDLDGVFMSGDKRNLSLSRSLDQSSFRTRSVRKLTWAWNATTVIPVSVQAGVVGQSGAVVLYSHNIAMPMMTHIFGEYATVAGRSGYYKTFSRTFVYPAQVPANPVYPEP